MRVKMRAPALRDHCVVGEAEINNYLFYIEVHGVGATERNLPE